MYITNQVEKTLPIYMNASQIAEYLGISRAKVYQFMRAEGFPILRVGKRMIVASKDLLNWIEENTGKQ